MAGLRDRVDGLRKAAGLQPIGWDPALFGPSQELAEGIAAGKKAAAEKRYDQRLDGLPYRSVAHHEVLAPNFAALDERCGSRRGSGRWVSVWRRCRVARRAGSPVVIVTVGER